MSLTRLLSRTISATPPPNLVHLLIIRADIPCQQRPVWHTAVDAVPAAVPHVARAGQQRADRHGATHPGLHHRPCGHRSVQQRVHATAGDHAVAACGLHPAPDTAGLWTAVPGGLRVLVGVAECEGHGVPSRLRMCREHDRACSVRPGVLLPPGRHQLVAATVRERNGLLYVGVAVCSSLCRGRLCVFVCVRVGVISRQRVCTCVNAWSITIVAVRTVVVRGVVVACLAERRCM